jgi:Rad3-related DNA helicase
MSVGWAPAPEHIEEKLGTLGVRAKKRTGIQLTPTTFKVFGDPKLGDSFDSYDIRLEGTKYHCSCQQHRGGEYRHLCSHISYVIFARRGIVEWAGEPSSNQTEGHLSLPETPLPFFVDQGQPWTEAVRELLDQHFGDSPPLPSWIKFIRPQQWDAYCEILSHLDAGKRVVFLAAPTGAGKTLVAEMVRRSFRKKALYTCTTKSLQDQFERDFTYAKVIKGRANYRTQNFPEVDWIACDLCEATPQNRSCRYCTNACPYTMAKDAAGMAPLAVANVAYFLNEGQTEHSRFAGRGLVIVDEADSLEEELMRFIEISLSPRMQKRLGISPPEKKTVTDSWQSWVSEEALPKINMALSEVSRSREPRDVRLRNTLTRLKDKLRHLVFDDNWVYTGYEQGYITFKPIRVDDLAPGLLWPMGRQWLLMSATIISAAQMAEDLGLSDDEWALVDVPSTFPPERRPIYVEPIADMTAKNAEIAWPQMASRISQIAAHHDERILVHTVSYKLAGHLSDSLGSRVVTYRSANERETALRRFRASSNGILIAPSFERGIDLPDDECRVVVVAKVPFPYLGDKQVNKRLYSRGGRGWYAMQTVRSLVQMTGRAMRHEEDECEIYLLDRQFVSSIWKKSRHLLPEWWKDALQMGGSPNLAEMRSRG